MKTYLVGGYVRDTLLGLYPSDRDYVVVGSTEEEMLSLGYERVGAEFPVFLHPQTREEYALARREGQGGFGPEVTLEEDLYRRDLTINSMAMDPESEEIIDPYGGQEDLKKRRLTPTSSAFADDPIRALRAARFASKFPHFLVSRKLIDAIKSLQESGAFTYLTAERIWMELEKALECPAPENFFIYLLGTGIFPELESMIGVEEKNLWHPERDVFDHIMLALRAGADLGFDKYTLFGVLCHDFGKPAAYKASQGLKSTGHEQLGLPIVKRFCERLKAPKSYTRIAMLSCERHTDIHTCFNASPVDIRRLLTCASRGDIMSLLEVAQCDKKGRGAPSCDWVYPQPEYLKACLRAMDTVDIKAISSSMLQGPAVGYVIGCAQAEAISHVDVTEYDKEYNELIEKVFKKVKR